jgi:hypothetical protein
MRQNPPAEAELIDDAGRKNVKPVQFTINAAEPASACGVSGSRPGVSRSKLDLKATAWDDFGIKRFGLSYSLGTAAGDGPGRNATAREAELRTRSPES